MATKQDKSRIDVEKMSLYEKQKLLDELLKDGRIDYPFKEMHQKELAQAEERMKERLAETVKVEFQGTIRILRQENNRLKEQLEETGKIYEEHLTQLKKELENEKQTFMQKFVHQQQGINEEHRKEIKKNSEKHRIELNQKEIHYIHQLQEKDDEIETLISKVKKASDENNAYVEPITSNMFPSMKILNEETVHKLTQKMEKSIERLAESVPKHPDFSSLLPKNPSDGELSIGKTKEEIQAVFMRYENHVIDERLCQQILDEIGDIYVTFTCTNWAKKESISLFSFNARKICPIFSSSLALLRSIIQLTY